METHTHTHIVPLCAQVSTAEARGEAACEEAMAKGRECTD